MRRNGGDPAFYNIVEEADAYGIHSGDMGHLFVLFVEWPRIYVSATTCTYNTLFSNLAQDAAYGEKLPLAVWSDNVPDDYCTDAYDRVERLVVSIASSPRPPVTTGDLARVLLRDMQIIMLSDPFFLMGKPGVYTPPLWEPMLREFAKVR
jgi:hypothetical protein